MFKVIRKFKDKETGHIYEIGDIFPVKGVEVEMFRIKELSSSENNAGVAMIIEEEYTKEIEKPKKRSK